MNWQDTLKNIKPTHEYFIGIDSDGCVFDTMEVKQKEFFIPNALKYFDLFSIAKILRETWEFVNLYSVFRGGNRFVSIIKVFELLNEREEIRQAGLKLPDLDLLIEWVNTETKLSNENLRKYFELNYDADLEKVVIWTEAVNEDISKWLRNIPPFPQAKLSLEKISLIADIVIVSQTPLEALQREWDEHDLAKYVHTIAGQEHGTKTEHLAFAAKDKYPDKKILMIGDAKGDFVAAKNNGVSFYPIIPGREDKSWERFFNEGFDRFINGNFEGNYENALLREFRETLPETPPWL
jgi:phosphoglycolate phosphatase-like HAD superfamily hydrolase